MNILRVAVEMCDLMDKANSSSEVTIAATQTDWDALKSLMPAFRKRLENTHAFGLKIGKRTVNFVLKDKNP